VKSLYKYINGSIGRWNSRTPKASNRKGTEQMQDKTKETKQKIIARYETESTGCCALGCGNTMDFLEIMPGEDILDLGCGRGEETLDAARQTGPSGMAMGLDLTTAMVEKARQNARDTEVQNAGFVQGDIEFLPFKSECFDGVTSNCVINHASDKARVYREIHRVLRKGGRFVVADAVTKVPLPQKIKDDPEAWAQCFGGAITEAEYLEAIQSAGFDEIIILNRREYMKNDIDFISLTIKALK